MKMYLVLGFLLLLAGCSNHPKSSTPPVPAAEGIPLYSRSVGDSFRIFVRVPASYHPGQAARYPVVYLLDANFYFDIMAAALQKYEPVGLAPEVILVGIGYRDFAAMDSLRDRDDTYPEAIKKYEMRVSGGADKFLSFIRSELRPFIESNYPADSAKRVLMGHSLGGYFTMYALWQELSGNGAGFRYFIAASPSMEYNHYYLLQQLEAAPISALHKKDLKAFVTYGGLEDTEDPDDPPAELTCAQVCARLSAALSGPLRFKSEVYSGLGHMDMAFPTLTKGLHWELPQQ